MLRPNHFVHESIYGRIMTPSKRDMELSKMTTFLYTTLVILMLLLGGCADFDGNTLQAVISICCAGAMTIVGIIDRIADRSQAR